jgi:hypothetical protein
MSRPDFSGTRLFKYLTPEGAKKTLSTGTLRLSKPSTFNDPFDMHWDDVIGLDFRDFVEQQKIALFELLTSDLDTDSLRKSKSGAKAALIVEAMRNATPEQKAAIKEQLLATPIEKLYDFDSLEKSRHELVNTIKEQMSHHGVFCTTLRHDSLLMWAHYTQMHQGAVLEFRADIDQDSALLASRPVRYSKERPLIYRTPSDLVRRALLMSTQESANDIFERLIYVKSTEWEYEQEYRLAIPDFVKEGADFATLQFYPVELMAIYLGCRMARSDKGELVDLARSVNKSVEVYEAHVSPREYALIFETVI